MRYLEGITNAWNTRTDGKNGGIIEELKLHKCELFGVKVGLREE